MKTFEGMKLTSNKIIFLTSTFIFLFGLKMPAFGNPIWMSSKVLSSKAGRGITIFCGYGHFFPESRFGLDEADSFKHDGVGYLKGIYPSGKRKSFQITSSLQGRDLILASIPASMEGNYIFYSENKGMYKSRTVDGKIIYKSKENAEKEAKIIKSTLEKTYMKVIVPVGSQITNSVKKDPVTNPVGLEFEFVPIVGMESVKAGGYLKAKLFCQGKLLPHAKINFRFTGNSKVGKESREYFFTTTTSNWGIARIKIYNPGTYLISSEKFIQTPLSKKHTEKRLRAVLVFKVL